MVNRREMRRGARRFRLGGAVDRELIARHHILNRAKSKIDLKFNITCTLHRTGKRRDWRRMRGNYVVAVA
jgi:hypothetical protein